MDNTIDWNKWLKELVQEYGEVEGGKMFLGLMMGIAFIQRQVDELDNKKEK